MIRALIGALVVVAGLAGLLVMAAIAAQFVGFRFVTLATGSMSPGLPAGSMLLVRDTDARAVNPGDVVTVLRADGLPVTHRVVTSAAEGERVRLVLRGDANAQPDRDSYLVSRVGLMVAGAAGVGSLAELARHPGAVPVLTAGVSLLVLWAWWPQRRRPAHRRALERGRRVVGREGAA